VGPFGLIYRRSNCPQPIYDELPQTAIAIYPLFHVMRALLQMAGAPRVSVRGAPQGVVGVGSQSSAGSRLILANLTNESCHLKLPREAYVRRLDQDTFQFAICDPDWLSTSPSERCSHIVLDAFNVAFVDLPKAGA
jgi:hypothetical protein